MPRVSEFYGIVITMFFRDHNPPRFDAAYGEYGAAIGIDPIVLLEGRPPARQRNMVEEWAEQYQTELAENWRRARERQAPIRIAPLP